MNSTQPKPFVINQIAIISVGIILAIVCFYLSIYTLNASKFALKGYEDCRGADGFSVPGNCADTLILDSVRTLEFKSQLLFFSGFALLLVSGILPLIIRTRATKSDKDKIESILSA